MRFAAVAATCLVGLVALVASARRGAADDAPKVWPPVGPAWETDPETAFEKARKQEKAVFVYVATES